MTREADADEKRSIEYLRGLVDLVERVLGKGASELTLAQLRALVALASSGPMRSIDLATALSLDPSTVSRLCARLEDRGLVTLRRSRQSKREIQITLTRKARRLLEAVLASGQEGIRRTAVRLG